MKKNGCETTSQALLMKKFGCETTSQAFFVWTQFYVILLD